MNSIIKMLPTQSEYYASELVKSSTSQMEQVAGREFKLLQPAKSLRR